MQAVQEIMNNRGSERYEQYRLFEEKTDIGERLALPIENHLELEVIGDGVYGRDIDGTSRRMTDWARESYVQALNDPGFSGSNAVERLRRSIELDEAEAVERLEVGQVLWVLSPIPDAAMAGKTSISGYRTDLARTFGRAYHRQENSVRSVTFSLEQSNKRALASAVEAMGEKLPDSLQSEEILATRFVSTMSSEQFDRLPDDVRLHYDYSLREQTGITFFAGNRLGGRQDSMRFIDANHDIIDEHMSVLRSIESRLSAGPQLASELEKLRQRTAAALDVRLYGGQVSSIGDSTVSGQLESGNYGGECATNGTQSSQEQMGLAQGKHTTNCPLCGTRGVTATVEGETITCSDCAGSVDICTGKVTRGKKKRIKTDAPSERPLQFFSQESKKTATIEELYGKKTQVMTEKTIGGENRFVIDRSGKVVAKL